MLRWLAAVVIFVLVIPALGKDTVDEIHLRATVQSVVLRSDFKGKAIPIGFDPRFAMTLLVQSATPTTNTLSQGNVVVLLIHSPTLLCNDDSTVGKTYDFVLRRTKKHGKIRFPGATCAAVRK